MSFTSEHDAVPNVRIYRWEDWSHGLLTKKQLGNAGYQTGKKLPPVAGVLPRSESPDGWCRLYDPAQAVPKRTPTVTQLAALEKAKYMAEKVTNHCRVCNRPMGEITRKRYLANQGRHDQAVCRFCSDRIEEIEWARAMLESGGVILDTETTDLWGDIIQVGICDMQGNILLDTLVATEQAIAPGAFAVHGIDAARLDGAPSFTQVQPRIYDALHGRQLVIYNRSYDWPLLRDQCAEYHLPPPRTNDQYCAMLHYSQFVGDWSQYHGDYRWQALPGGDHSAIGDCLATLDVIRRMAAYDVERPYQRETDAQKRVPTELRNL